MATPAILAATALVSALLGAILAGLRWRWRLRAAQAEAALSLRGLADVRAVLARHQALYRIVTEDIACAVVGLDAPHQPMQTFHNSAGTPGLDPAELLTDRAADWVHPDDLGGLQATLAACGPDRQAAGALCRTQQQDGRLRWLEVHCRHVPEDGGIIAVLRDVSQRKQREEHLTDAVSRLEQLALHDPLTGLLNRPGFLALVDRVLASQQLLAVLFIDLDDFKALNDAHGHSIGDVVLREIGDRLGRVPGYDAMAARLSGDEFAVLLPGTDTDVEVAARARDILRLLAEPLRHVGMALDVSATIGVSVSPRDGRSATALLRAADIALAYGKSAGGSCYRFFETRMGEALDAETELKNELRAAIATGEIEPFYQPLVRIGDTTVVGFEVLARWVHPTKGVLAPDAFLPLVGELGLSSDMFLAQLQSVCTTASEWPAHIRLSVNLSPHELQNETLPDTVRALLERTGFDGTRLEIEITEDALIHDSKVARGVLDGLRAMGMTVSLDDFGTGYSSLYHLRELPFDKVKIDKSFTRALDTDADNERYVAAIIGLCHALGLEMTAEGIEDEPTLRRLRKLGCTYGQGYLFGRAVRAAEASEMLALNGGPALVAE
jgi:diguanylate cyclase (GGDEF)-like protein/PAS domain S-box-containing protein